MDENNTSLHPSQLPPKSFIADSKWIHTQKKAFKNFANYMLKQRNLGIKGDLETDLRDGILLCNLVEILTGRSVGKYNQNPKLRVQKINNINLALSTMQQAKPGLRITASAEDICDGKLNMLLGIVWTLVHEFHMQKFNETEDKKKSAKDMLLDWVIQELKDYGQYVDLASIKTDFPNSFKDGRVINFLIHKKRPDAVKIEDVMNKNARENLEFAFDTAQRELNIPKLFDADDVLQAQPDESSLLTYINFFRDISDHPSVKKEVEPAPAPKEPEEGGSSSVSSSTSTDSKSGDEDTTTSSPTSSSYSTSASTSPSHSDDEDNNDNEEEINILAASPVELLNAPLSSSIQETTQETIQEGPHTTVVVTTTTTTTTTTKNEEIESSSSSSSDSESERDVDTPVVDVTDQYKSEIARLGSAIKIKEAENENILNEYKELKDENDDLRQRVKTIELKKTEEIRLKEEIIADLELEVEEAKKMHKELKKKEQEIQILKEANEKLNLQLEEAIAAQVPAGEKEIAKKLQEKIDKMENEIIVLNEEAANKDDRYAEKLKKAKKKIKELQKQIEEFGKHVCPTVEEKPKLADATPSKFYLRIEDIIRRLNRKRGARLRFPILETEHIENKKFIAVVMELRKLVDEVIDEMIKNYKDANGDGDAIPRKAGDVIEDIERLLSFRSNLKSAKNDFVRECNRLGKLYSRKSRNEKQMEEWRYNLEDIADNKPETITEDNEKLWDDIELVKTLLEKDTKYKQEIKIAQVQRRNARTAVQTDLDDLTEFIRIRIDKKEEYRLRGLVKDLKERNRILETPSGFVRPTDRDIRISRTEAARISNVLRIMIRNRKQLFREYSDDIRQIGENSVHPMVQETIRFLEEEGHLRTKDLFAKSNQPRDKMETLKEYFYAGKDVQFKPESDPYAVAELLKEYFKDLPQPLLTFKRYQDFDKVNELSDDKALVHLSECIEELPKYRRATLTVLIVFLSKVARYADENNMTVPVIADIFGPLLLCPRHGWNEHKVKHNVT